LTAKGALRLRTDSERSKASDLASIGHFARFRHAGVMNSDDSRWPQWPGESIGIG
jgi:hypothetical protein